MLTHNDVDMEGFNEALINTINFYYVCILIPDADEGDLADIFRLA